METLKTKKITLSTVKAFAKKHSDNLYASNLSSFDGMSDMVEKSNDTKFKKTQYLPEKNNYYQTGIQGFYTVGGSRNWFKFYEDDKFYGIEVYNCCGSDIIATLKN